MAWILTEVARSAPYLGLLRTAYAAAVLSMTSLDRYVRGQVEDCATIRNANAV